MSAKNKKSRFAAAWKQFAPVTRGFLEFYSQRIEFFDPYSGPMNGQTARLEIIREIITELDIKLIVETGTFRGVTTRWFAQFNVPVIGIELSKRFATFTKLRLGDRPNVEIRRGNSVVLLKDIAAERAARNERVLFYLDAHWENELPLREEIEIITRHFPQAVIVIDDFAVPDDPDYVFDDYGPGKRLDLDLVQSAVAPPLAIFFPAVAARHETGMRCGSVIFTADQEIAGVLGRFALLRSWPTLNPRSLEDR